MKLPIESKGTHMIKSSINQNFILFIYIRQDSGLKHHGLDVML